MSSYLAGKNTILELLKSQPSRIKHIYVAIDLAAHQNQLLATLIQENRTKILQKDKKFLDHIAPGAQHQGVVAEVSERKIYALNEYLKQARPEFELLVVLDEISDPHNFGAMLRAVECLGATAVLWSNVRNSGITDVVTKVSVGASELVKLIQVTNIANALSELKKNDFWVVATALDGESQPVQSFEFPKKTALLLGSEGSGLKSILLKSSDFKIFLPMYGQIDSLNVSQATAVFLSYWRDYVVKTEKNFQ